MQISGAQTLARIAQLRAAAVASSVVAFVLIALGAIVRINDAGMTCPDWPRCRGVWFPQLTDPVVYEWVHRQLAVILTILLVATVVAAWRVRGELPNAMRAAWVAVGMVAAQIVVGWLTIKFANNPPSVAAHLVVGFGTFATSALLALISFRGPAAVKFASVEPSRGAPSSALAILTLATTAAAFATVFVGGLMSAAHAGAACGGFPLCDGWRQSVGIAQTIHMNHRYLAYLTFALVIACFVAARRANAPKAVLDAAGLALALAVLQLGLGVAAVVSGLVAALRVAHEANGALLVASLVALTFLTLMQGRGRELFERTKQYVALTKLNVMSLLLFITLMTMIVAQRGMPSPKVLLATLVGGALASGAAGAINMYVDRDIDAMMKRTARRPIPSGAIAPGHALAFGIVLAVLSFFEMTAFVNLLAASLAVAGIAYYVFVYTIWLKRVTPQNIVVGGAAGAIPPLVGWAAVTNHVGLAALLLFLIVFVWTPPHFWALALMAKKQYAEVGIPMLPVVRGDAETKRQIVAYSAVLAALTLVAVPLHMMGVIYLVCAVVLDGIFLYHALRVSREGSIASQRALYRYSMLYLALLFVAMVVDRVLGGAGA